MPFPLILFFILFSATSFAAEKEIWYQKVWCEGKNGKVEYKLKDGRRVDCLTKTHAIEMDFASKWPEAIGQSLDYSMLTGKKAGIVLILNKNSELEHWRRLKLVIKHYKLPITTWRLGP